MEATVARSIETKLLALLLAAVLGLPVAFAGIQAGLEGWPLTLLVLPVMFIASLVDRDGFYGHR